jgi:hypothetical protein
MRRDLLRTGAFALALAHDCIFVNAVQMRHVRERARRGVRVVATADTNCPIWVRGGSRLGLSRAGA